MNYKVFSDRSDTSAIYAIYAIYVAPDLKPLGKLGVLNTENDYLSMSNGAVKMSVAGRLNGSDFVNHPAITYFISAFQHGKMATNVTVDNQPKTARVVLGDDMYFEFPNHAWADDFLLR